MSAADWVARRVSWPIAMAHGSTGIDLTPEFVETGQALSGWVDLGDRIDLNCGSALDLPFEADLFDAAYMMHVGMNIADKAGLFAQVARTLKPGGVFGIYDVMATADGDLVFPVPWAMTGETSALADPETYRAGLEAAGFTIVAERNRRDFAQEFFAALRAKAAGADGPPPLGIHVLMGQSAAEKIANMGRKHFHRPHCAL